MWGNHLRFLQHEAWRTQNEIVVVPIRQHLDDPDFGADKIANCVANAFADQQCDSMFLTAVSSDGIRLPINKILSRIDQRKIRQVFVDGAQEFAHVGECQMMSRSMDTCAVPTSG